MDIYGNYGKALYNRIYKLTRKITVFKAHNAFLVIAKAEKVDATVPCDFLVDHGEFLMKIGFEFHLYSAINKKICVLLYSFLFMLFEIFRRACNNNDGNSVEHYRRKQFYGLRQPVFTHKRTDDKDL